MDRARQNQDSYDRVADQYLERSRDRSLLRPWMQRFKERLPSDAPVLDLGAGPCLDSAELRSLGLRVISVDRSWRMLMAAHEETPGQRVQADIRQLPFQPDCLAGVWACASLLHLDRDQLVPAVSDIRNVLVSGAPSSCRSNTEVARPGTHRDTVRTLHAGLPTGRRRPWIQRCDRRVSKSSSRRLKQACVTHGLRGSHAVTGRSKSHRATAGRRPGVHDANRCSRADIRHRL